MASINIISAMVVRMRHTRAHTANRRSHHALKNPPIGKDKAGNVHLRHRMDPTTGSYRGRVVVDVAAKATRRAAKKSKQEKSVA